MINSEFVQKLLAFVLFIDFNFIKFYTKLVDCLEKCLIYGHIRRFAN